MKVILMQDLRHGGTRGDVITVKPGYARNYLFPNGYALEATDGNLKLFQEQRKKIEEKHEQLRATAVEEAAKFEGVEVTITRRVSEADTLYGAVTAAEVAEALENAGHHVDRKRIDLEGGIKAVGEYPVRIEIHSDVTAEIKVHIVGEE